ncbi:RpnC/YadD family protein [Acidaminococcus massiliensis]|jgi:hypothetical protein|uniref:hypothetical protein n=1 Tax=Acidaminococcus massiliensis TaxID=1852375 RepID=UPI00094F2061|nr:hypothetical protein [Acidaminococcus massiliensis]
MKISTTVAQDLGTWQEEQALDAACCRLLANKIILAHILQGCLPEYEHCSIPELLPCLEGTPAVCSVAVDQDALNPGRVRGENTADKSITEGNVNFDILFSARTPDGSDSRQIFINVESQDTWSPGYPLLKRAAYYCGRLLSRQKGIVFQNSDYQKLQKVYSLWVCLDPPKSKENTLTAFHIKEENLVGNAKYGKMNYDMVSMMMICLGQPDHRQEDIIHLLSVLLSTKMDPDVKKEILEREYDIPMTIEMKKEAETMCGIGHAIARKNLEKGIEQGIEKGLEKGRMEEREANIVAMLKEKIPMETISRITHYSLDQIQKLGKLHGLL